MAEGPRPPDNALDSHVHHQFAHPEMESRLRVEQFEAHLVEGRATEEWRAMVIRRLTALERFQWVLVGMGTAISLTLGIFGAALASHMVH